MNTSLLELHRRLSDPSPFLRTVLTDVCNKCVAVLKANMYGRKLPNEWTSEIKVSKADGKATVFHTRLEGDRTTWEPIFGFHNHGTRAHGPVTALVMHWIDRDTGEDIFAKWVKGITAKHFAEKAERIISDYEQTLQGKWERWMNTGRL